MKCRLMTLTTHPTTQQGATHHLKEKCIDNCWKCGDTFLHINTKNHQSCHSRVCFCLKHWCSITVGAWCSKNIAGSSAVSTFRYRAGIWCWGMGCMLQVNNGVLPSPHRPQRVTSTATNLLSPSSELNNLCSLYVLRFLALFRERKRRAVKELAEPSPLSSPDLTSLLFSSLKCM